MNNIKNFREFFENALIFSADGLRGGYDGRRIYAHLRKQRNLNSPSECAVCKKASPLPYLAFTYAETVIGCCFDDHRKETIMFINKKKFENWQSSTILKRGVSLRIKEIGRRFRELSEKPSL